METIQELKDEMARLQEDNERMMQEQEKIMKILLERQNHQPLIPSPEHVNMTGEQEFRTENVETESGKENHEEESDNLSRYKTQKRQKMELQWEIRKIKPPLFDGE